MIRTSRLAGDTALVLMLSLTAAQAQETVAAQRGPILLDLDVMLKVGFFMLSIIGSFGFLFTLYVKSVLSPATQSIALLNVEAKRVDENLRELERIMQSQDANARVELTKNREKGAEVETQLRSFEKIEEMRWAEYAEFKRAVLGRLYQYGEITTPAPPGARAQVQIAHPKPQADPS